MWNAQIKQFVVTDLKTIFGKGPDSVKVNISENIIILDIKGSLTPLENSLLKSNPDNKEVVKNIRKQLLDNEMGNINAQIQTFTNNKEYCLENYTFEIDFRHDRHIIILIFNKSLEFLHD